MYEKFNLRHDENQRNILLKPESYFKKKKDLTPLTSKVKLLQVKSHKILGKDCWYFLKNDISWRGFQLKQSIMENHFIFLP